MLHVVMQLGNIIRSQLWPSWSEMIKIASLSKCHQQIRRASADLWLFFGAVVFLPWIHNARRGCATGLPGKTLAGLTFWLGCDALQRLSQKRGREVEGPGGRGAGGGGNFYWSGVKHLKTISLQASCLLFHWTSSLLAETLAEKLLLPINALHSLLSSWHIATRWCCLHCCILCWSLNGISLLVSLLTLRICLLSVMHRSQWQLVDHRKTRL